MKRGKFDGVYLARREDAHLFYGGKVEHGFDSSSEKDLQRRAGKLKSKT
jgi:hypothetical protein